jgi:ABC-type sugar transport system substrate-binding protein
MSPIKYRVYLVIVLALAVSALIGLTQAVAPVSPAQAQEATAEATAEAMTPAFKILAVEKTLINEHWQIMQKGYEWAAKRYNVAIDVVSVPTEADTAAQLDLVESALAKGYDGIAVSPITPNNLNPALAKASEMGIPIVNVDELIPEDVAKDAGIVINTRIASNNYYAGVLAAQYMLDNLPAGSQVAVIEGIAGNSSGTARRDGFVETIEASGALEIVANQPADWDRAKANSVTTNILQANPDLKGIYYANDTMALGGAEAVEAAGMEGLILIGTDAIPEATQAVSDGRLTGTVAQYPFEMASLAVETLLKILNDRPVAPRVDAPIKLLLKADVDAGAAPEPPAQPKNYKILAVEKTLINEHWQIMAEGYAEVAEVYGQTIDVVSVPTEADTAAQLDLVESALAKGYDGIAVSPITPNNLNPALAKASEMGIPIVNVDELIPEDVAKDAGIVINTRIASNNYYAGVLAAQYMLDNLPAGSQVAVIEGIAGNSSGTARRDGFVETIEASGALEIVANQPADWDRAKANSVTTNILQANPDLKGIYYANDTMALGGAEAVEAAGMEGLILIGTDAIPEATQAVSDGRLTGTVAQFPREMAWLAVENLIKVLEGRPIAPRIDAPIKLLLAADVQ